MDHDSKTENPMNERDLWEKVINGVDDTSLNLSKYFSHQILGDISHLLFSFSRYKFTAKLIGTCADKKVLELGCNEGLGTLFLSKVSAEVLGVDFDERAIEWAKSNLQGKQLKFLAANILGGIFGTFDVVVSIDVVEHICPENAELFFRTVYDNLKADGFCIIGTPNSTAQQYASEYSKVGHVNLYDAKKLYQTMSLFFANVFIFSMNDEVVHTGFYPMAHYLIALGVGKKECKTI